MTNAAGKAIGHVRVWFSTHSFLRGYVRDVAKLSRTKTVMMHSIIWDTGITKLNSQTWIKTLALCQHSLSSFPFSLPRSFLSFFGFFRGPSSPVAASGTRLWDPDWPGAVAGPVGSATGSKGGWELELGVGSISPSVKDWYCNRDFKRNLDEKQSVTVNQPLVYTLAKKNPKGVQFNTNFQMIIFHHYIASGILVFLLKSRMCLFRQKTVVLTSI